ncbi:unnamed protein product [Darwinula stevensoni]|uniref:Uncharacterized protein n=1 Tax=Darwinula stevensoni TaxID=69355 RepID=A0A7R9FP37_9CRUS|nr:unnamed protein product [Darwinula stevensoni]CAG0897451.1 unnamed protein product [Darwinula stevensoni]
MINFDHRPGLHITNHHAGASSGNAARESFGCSGQLQGRGPPLPHTPLSAFPIPDSTSHMNPRRGETRPVTAKGGRKEWKKLCPGLSLLHLETSKFESSVSLHQSLTPFRGIDLASYCHRGDGEK